MKYKIIRFTPLVLIIAVFSYCKKPTQFKEVQVTNLFTMQIPTYMYATAETYPFPVELQYCSDSLKTFLMVMDTFRVNMNENTLESYYDSVISQPIIDSAVITPAKLVKLNNDSAYISEMTGIDNGVKVFYEMEAVATKERYFMLLTWGRLDKRETLRPDMMKMLSSFCDLSHRKI